MKSPQPESDYFPQVDDSVEHDTYGHGVVLHVAGDKITVKFKREEKRILRNYLRPATPGAANDNEPSSRLKLVNPADWHGQPIPKREWFVPDLIPARNVTLLTGDGGVGKSLIALQIAVASALGISTIGLSPKRGRVFYLGAEDEEGEFHRRVHDIVKGHGCSLADLGAQFKLSPMAGEDATLALPDRGKNMQPTQVMLDLIDAVVAYEPDLLVLDTSADLFGGDEINRVQVRQFVGMLRSIAIGVDCAVLLLAHPSLEGKDMSPAVDMLEVTVAQQKLNHGNNPLMKMCAANAVVTMDPAGARKLDKDKAKANGRIDGIVALAMALKIAASHEEDELPACLMAA